MRTLPPYSTAYTLAELIIGMAILSIIMGGMISAFVTAARLQKAQNGPMIAEASSYAQDWLEALRNRVAADDTFFQNRAGNGWLDDDSQTNPPPQQNVVRRVYRVDARDCDGVPPAGDCYQVTVKVCWNQAIC